MERAQEVIPMALSLSSLAAKLHLVDQLVVLEVVVLAVPVLELVEHDPRLPGENDWDRTCNPSSAYVA